MTKKEQKIFIEDTLKLLKGSGITLEWFLKAVGISRTHWFFIKKAERPLTNENYNKIIAVIKIKCSA